MRCEPTSIDGLLRVSLERNVDERGHFTRWFDGEVLRAHGFVLEATTGATSGNARAGTLRGLHYQLATSPEHKLVRCTAGRVFDVVVDTRPSSPTFRAVEAFTLEAGDDAALAIPPGCAHGFLTLADESDVSYLISGVVDGAAARGVRWDDPSLDIAWPATPVVISDRDASYPDVDWSRLDG